MTSFGAASVNTTVESSRASTFFMAPSSEAGPLGSLMSTIRWKEKATSDAVSSLPFANVRPSFTVQTYSVGVSKSQDSAASGVRSVLPAGKFIRYW